MKHGAFDFLPKPFTPEELRLIVTRGLEQRKLLLETAELREEKARMQQYFITIVAHELRSPLLLVKQYLDLIVGGKMGKVDDTAGEMLSGAHSTLDGASRHHRRLAEARPHQTRVTSPAAWSRSTPRPILEQGPRGAQAVARTKRRSR